MRGLPAGARISWMRGLPRMGAFPAKPVPGKPGTYGGVCPLSYPVNAALAAQGAAHFVDAGLAPHGAFPAKPVPGEPGTYGGVCRSLGP